MECSTYGVFSFSPHRGHFGSAIRPSGGRDLHGAYSIESSGVSKLQWGKQTLMESQPWYGAPLQFQAMCTQQNMNSVIVLVLISSVFISALPLFFMISQCS
jgi:hypothetical protein